MAREIAASTHNLDMRSWLAMEAEPWFYKGLWHRAVRRVQSILERSSVQGAYRFGGRPAARASHVTSTLGGVQAEGLVANTGDHLVSTPSGTHGVTGTPSRSATATSIGVNSK